MQSSVILIFAILSSPATMLPELPAWHCLSESPPCFLFEISKWVQY